MDGHIQPATPDPAGCGDALREEAGGGVTTAVGAGLLMTVLVKPGLVVVDGATGGEVFATDGTPVAELPLKRICCPGRMV
ncbi:hypothetical protein D9M71_616190 [compost metagenome]